MLFWNFLQHHQILKTGKEFHWSALEKIHFTFFSCSTFPRFCLHWIPSRAAKHWCDAAAATISSSLWRQPEEIYDRTNFHWWCQEDFSYGHCSFTVWSLSNFTTVKVTYIWWYQSCCCYCCSYCSSYKNISFNQVEMHSEDKLKCDRAAVSSWLACFADCSIPVLCNIWLTIKIY